MSSATAGQEIAPRPLAAWPAAERRRVEVVFTDIDDTLTRHGRLPAVAYAAMERLAEAGLRVIPITGRPAGWCDHIARMWPVEGVVGENGAFWFRHDPAEGRLVRRFLADEATRRANRARLDELARRILAEVPGTALASDQLYREADLAIDFCEDVPPQPDAAVARIVALFEAAGCTAKVSSIHVNGWFGSYDKLTMTRLLMREAFDVDIDQDRARFVFAGDSPNDQPMFGFFPASVGVANLRRFLPGLAHAPRWLTMGEGGHGFAELADLLLAVREPPRAQPSTSSR
jgi:HAD superfamily hydrolase (TIGR01484 family)